MSDQSNSDPLPYTQVDRAVKPKATLLAAMMNTTTQHALGSLVEFWDLNGDPRELEDLLKAGKRAVILAKETVQRRFKIASGHDVDPENLEALGLLERVGNSFRVRGMSRYFEPVERRLQARSAAAKGGLASAEARKKKFGSAQPRSGSRSEAVRTPLERDSNRTGSDTEATPEPDTEATPEATSNTAVSGQRSATATVKTSAPASRTRALSDRLLATFLDLRGSEYRFANSVDGPALARLVKTCRDDNEIDRRWRLGLRGQYQQAVSTIAQLDSKWNALTTRSVPSGPTEARRGVGEHTATHENLRETA